VEEKQDNETRHVTMGKIRKKEGAEGRGLKLRELKPYEMQDEQTRERSERQKEHGGPEEL
jgi:hypothetical protein